MYVFDIAVYVGMYPNSCMMNDVVCVCYYVCGLCVSIVLLYIIIVAGCITLGQTNKSSAEGISPKVLEHDEEHNRYMKRIWLQLCVCKQSIVDWRSLRFIHLEGST